MAIVKIGNRTDKPFAIIDNNLLNDNRLSWRAKGILCYLIGRPHDWTIVTEHLVTQGTEGRDAVRSAFQELKELGYATLETHRNDSGKITGSVWTVHETPQNREPEKPRPEKPSDGESNTTNTDGTKTEKTTNKDRAKPFQKPDRDSVYTYGSEIGVDLEPCDAFYDYQESKGWKVGTAPMKDWQAALRTWKRNGEKFGKKPEAMRPSITNDGIWQGYLDSLCREWNPAKPDVKYAQNALRRARGHVDVETIRDYLKASLPTTWSYLETFLREME